MAGEAGIEPATNGLTVRGSAAELLANVKIFSRQNKRGDISIAPQPSGGWL